ncbi:hypothetical protein CFP65_7401 [Kitasatospora sp. MMS16-BH015]|uniref:extracellular solute-binding protein n=1 Tax=Kitasatospora sp. MMS16-BH015 TaxID=2018025 RepID=UPI000CA11AE6|nr:extracellular solute-binding protein [Kitasatospora sp. MMS16-BH015]AUG81982.1 hypothetical protein CFP65_7401 [Kitasatospora sp. MMS16-BH015]
MNRRVLTTLAAAVAAALVAAGWAYHEQQADPLPDATLTLVAADYGSGGTNPSQAYWEALAAAFHQEHPGITVRVRTYGWNDIAGQLDGMVAAKAYPDIVEGPRVDSWAKQGLLYPVDQIGGDGAVEMRLPHSLLAATGEGTTSFALPFVSSSRAFLINDRLWQQAGLPMTGGKAVAPRTWAEVEEAARRMKAAGVPVPLGLPLGPEEAQGELFMWEMGNLGGYTDSTGSWTVNSPQNKATLTQLKHWVDEGLTEPAPASVDRTALFTEFAAGRVGMLDGAPVQLSGIASGHLDVTWAPLPTAQDGQASRALGVADWLSAFKAGGHRAQIEAFLAFAYRKQWQVRFGAEYDLLPVTIDALDQLRTDRPELNPFVDALNTARFMPTDLTGWSAVSHAIQTRAGRLLDDPQALDQVQQIAIRGGS